MSVENLSETLDLKANHTALLVTIIGMYSIENKRKQIQMSTWKHSDSKRNMRELFFIRIHNAFTFTRFWGNCSSTPSVCCWARTRKFLQTINSESSDQHWATIMMINNPFTRDRPRFSLAYAAADVALPPVPAVTTAPRCSVQRKHTWQVSG